MTSPQPWELRGWDEHLLAWVSSPAEVHAELLLRILDWGIQARRNGPPKTATWDEVNQEWHARVPGTEVVVSYVEHSHSLIVSAIG